MKNLEAIKAAEIPQSVVEEKGFKVGKI